jgi:hypothetical protein
MVVLGNIAHVATDGAQGPDHGFVLELTFRSPRQVGVERNMPHALPKRTATHGEIRGVGGATNVMALGYADGAVVVLSVSPGRLAWQGEVTIGRPLAVVAMAVGPSRLFIAHDDGSIWFRRRDYYAAAPVFVYRAHRGRGCRS